MMFGKNPFTVESDKLTLKFEPAIPNYLIGEDRKVKAMFLGSVPVTYSFDGIKDYIPGEYEIGAIVLTYKNNTLINVYNGAVEDTAAADVRDGKVKSIEVSVIKKEH